MDRGVTPLTLMWRGPLDSCNYGCSYCPFAKRPARIPALERDTKALARFTGWILGQERRFQVLFTPYGEALIWPAYQETLRMLSWCPAVVQVAIQSNGSAPVSWISGVNLEKLRLWLSWHPSEVALPDFVARVKLLVEAGVLLSVGAVAVAGALEAVEALRAALPAAVPMWINAQKPGPRLDAATAARWTEIDPDFHLDRRAHRSRGLPCSAGETSLFVDGEGDVRRCHFVGEVLGNLYDAPIDGMLAPRPCPRLRCDCFIGYSRLKHLDLERRLGPGLVSRRRPLAVLACPS